MLWHLGHRGSSRDSITYIMHRGHPARIIGSGAPAASGLPSDDTHELGGDAVDDDDDDSRLGEAPPPPPPTPTPPRWPPVAPPDDDGAPRDRDDRLSRSPCSFDPTLPLFLLIFLSMITKPSRAPTTAQQLTPPTLSHARAYYSFLWSARLLVLPEWNEAGQASSVARAWVFVDLWCGGATPVCVI